MKTTFSWFDVVALLLILLMSVVSGVTTDAGRANPRQALAIGQQ